MVGRREKKEEAPGGGVGKRQGNLMKLKRGQYPRLKKTER